MTCGQLGNNDVTRAKNIGWNPRATGYDAGSLGLDDREYLLGTAVEIADVARVARGEGPEVKAGTFVCMFGNPNDARDAHVGADDEHMN